MCKYIYINLFIKEIYYKSHNNSLQDLFSNYEKKFFSISEIRIALLIQQNSREHYTNWINVQIVKQPLKTNLVNKRLLFIKSYFSDIVPVLSDYYVILDKIRKRMRSSGL